MNSPLTKDKTVRAFDMVGCHPVQTEYKQGMPLLLVDDVFSAVQYLVEKAKSRYTPDWSYDADMKISVNDIYEAFPCFCGSHSSVSGKTTRADTSAERSVRGSNLPSVEEKRRQTMEEVSQTMDRCEQRRGEGASPSPSSSHSERGQQNGTDARQAGGITHNSRESAQRISELQTERPDGKTGTIYYSCGCTIVDGKPHHDQTRICSLHKELINAAAQLLSQPSADSRCRSQSSQESEQGALVKQCGDAGELSAGEKCECDADVKDASRKGNECGGKDCLESGCRCVLEDAGETPVNNNHPLYEQLSAEDKKFYDYMMRRMEETFKPKWESLCEHVFDYRILEDGVPPKVEHYCIHCGHTLKKVKA